MPNEKDLQVWWIPQVPMKTFNVEVKTLEEAHLLLDVLAKYDEFQFKNKVKPDYSNTGGLQIFEEGEWSDWYEEETGDDFNDYRDKYFKRINFPN